MATLIRVTDKRTGEIVWAHNVPDACPDGHTDGMVPAWRCCPTCGRRDSAYECLRNRCLAYSMDWQHKCDGRRITGKGFARYTTTGW